MFMIITVLYDPNLNFLGKHKLEIYSTATSEDIERLCKNRVVGFVITLHFLSKYCQSNCAD